jgi:hypothetical protein
MRMVSSPNDEFVFAQHQADPGADRGGMHANRRLLVRFDPAPPVYVSPPV